MMCWTGTRRLTNAAVLFPRSDWLWRGRTKKTLHYHSLLAALDFLCGPYGPAPDVYVHVHTVLRMVVHANLAMQLEMLRYQV